MHIIGVFLIFAAVLLRAAVVVSGEPEFPIVLTLLAVYGLLLSGQTWLMHRKPIRRIQPPQEQFAYLFLQSALVIAALILSSYEDFIAMLFIPLSLDAVSSFGRRVGFGIIAIFSLAMIVTLLFSDVGPLFGLVMGILYSGICFLVGGYAYQVQSAQVARNQNEQTLKELQTAHQKLQEYADQLESLAVEHERNRLARELHDSVTQTVFSMNLAAQSAQLLLKKEPKRAVEQLLRIDELAASALNEIQSLVSQLKLRPTVIEDLPTALRRLGAEQNVRNGLQISVEIHANESFPSTVATSLYFIVHEALTNVVKHSGTCEATVRLDVSGDHFRLEIEDHGRGFNPASTLGQRGHLGLAGMSERAREIGWHLSVLSKSGQGTRILVTKSPSGGAEWNG